MPIDEVTFTGPIGTGAAVSSVVPNSIANGYRTGYADLAALQAMASYLITAVGVYAKTEDGRAYVTTAHTPAVWKELAPFDDVVGRVTTTDDTPTELCRYTMPPNSNTTLALVANVQDPADPDETASIIAFDAWKRVGTDPPERKDPSATDITVTYDPKSAGVSAVAISVALDGDDLVLYGTGLPTTDLAWLGVISYATLIP